MTSTPGREPLPGSRIMTEHPLTSAIGRQVSLPGHFEVPVTLEDARPLGRDGASGFECRVRLPDGTLEETILSPAEATALAGTDSPSRAGVRPADAVKLHLLIESM